MTDNLPATSAPPTPAERQAQRIEFFMGELEKRQDQLSLLLSDSNVDPQVFLAVARRAFMKWPELTQCDAKSVLESFINCATDGLKPDGRQAAIVIYNVNVAPKNQPKKFVKKAQYIPMYQGLLDIAYRSGNYRTIGARVVYAGDEYSYSLGIGQTVVHKPIPRPAGKTPDIVAAYAFAVTKDGGEFFEPFEAEDIRKVRAVSRAISGPARDWPEEQTRKGPLRRMWKYLPKDDRMQRVIEREDSLYDLDIEGADDEAPAPEKKIRAGFAPQAPKAIAQGADQVINVEMPPIEDEVPEGEFEDVPQDGVEVQNGKVVSITITNQGDGYNPEAAESQMPPEPEDTKGPDSFMTNLAHASSWLNIKQALRTLVRTMPGFPIASARKIAYRRYMDLKESGADMPDFVTDPMLFLCWIDGALPHQDQINQNWALLQGSESFGKLSDSDKEEIAAYVHGACP